MAVICTDELKLNRDYSDGQDIVLVRPEVDDIVAKLAPLIANPGRLAELGARARQRMVQVFSREAQIEPRLDLLRRLFSL